jgi:ABC-2 type transport system ATP-binding protein
MILLDRVTRRFGKLTAVDDLSLQVPAGEIFGLVGPDGAGKTTTLRLLCGLLDPTSGRVEIDGLDAARHPDQVKDRIGYMPQKFGLYNDLTVQENMDFCADLFGLPNPGRALLFAELLAMTRMAPFTARPAGQLSGGMKQKLALMCVLLHKPAVLFLDEPTNGVDPLSRRDFWQILYRLAGDGITIFFTTAYLDEAERASRVGLMHRGRLIALGAPADLRARWRPHCFEAHASDPRAARSFLGAQPGVLGAVPAGGALHVYLDDPALAPALASALDRAGLGPASLVNLDPALEDAFIAAIRSEQRRDSQ